MKRIFKLIAAAFLSAAVMTGCSGGAEKIDSIEKLNGRPIGVQLGTIGETYAQGMTDNVECYIKGSDAVAALVEGKVDAVLIDMEPAKVYVSQNKKLMILDEPFAEEQYAVAVNKNNSTLKDKVNHALQQLEKEGVLDTIRDNWIGDEKGKHPYVTPKDRPAPTGTITIATNAEFPPFESMDEKGEYVGFDIDLIHAVCDILGLEPVIENMEFDNIIPAVESGNVNLGIAALTITDERLETVSFSDPYITTTQVIIVRK